MEKEKCKTLIELFQNIFKLPPSLVLQDELGCTVSTEIKHKNTKIILEVSELNEEERTIAQIQPIEFHELKLKDGSSHYIITFYIQETVDQYAVRIYIE